MNKLRLMLLAAALVTSLNAHAQLTSVDNGVTVQDADGLMFANTVRVSFLDIGNVESLAWVASLNAAGYGGYHDWTLATADPTNGINNTTNQLGQLFQVDCQNNGCSAFSALNNLPNGPELGFMSASVFAGEPPGCGAPTYYECTIAKTDYMYMVSTSLVGGSSYVIPFDTIPFMADGIAVRDAAVSAPEIGKDQTLAALTLLCGALLLLSSKRSRSAEKSPATIANL